LTSAQIAVCGVWILFAVVVVCVGLTTLLNSTTVSPGLVVVTPLGTAWGWAGVAFAFTQLLIVLLAPLALLVGLWSWRRRPRAT